MPLRLCAGCGAMIEAIRLHGGPVLRFTACPCGAVDILTPAMAPWRLTASDRRFLRTLRIAADDGPQLQLLRRPS